MEVECSRGGALGLLLGEVINWANARGGAKNSRDGMVSYAALQLQEWAPAWFTWHLRRVRWVTRLG